MKFPFIENFIEPGQHLQEPLSRSSREFTDVAAPLSAVSLGATGAAGLASCTSVKSTTAVAPTASATGPVAQEITLRARQAQIDLGGREATA